MSTTKLKELVAKEKSEVVNHDFMQLMKSGNINPELYAIYLWNQLKRYQMVEDCADQENLFDGIEDLKRYNAIRDDFEEIWYDQLGKKRAPEGYLQNTSQYMKHVREILKDEIADSLQIQAHIYALHLADIEKGQDFKDQVPGASRYHTFNFDIENMKNIVSGRCTDEMAEEANAVFDYNEKILDDLWALDIPKFK